ncbi:uncharacterized protein LOC141612465 isoform X5 [Silene latifolia]|uniref:uncharacterized protein LOC141612465 isoform X5 n=1 Tax=Silene latifolia TaxID=37657 RepID=UPI003D77B90C
MVFWFILVHFLSTKNYDLNFVAVSILGLVVVVCPFVLGNRDTMRDVRVLAYISLSLREICLHVHIKLLGGMNLQHKFFGCRLGKG